MRRRTEITIETERLVVVGGHARRAEDWCAPCGQNVEFITTDEAAIRSGVSSRTIFFWEESGRVHSAETPEGLLLICPNSLP